MYHDSDGGLDFRVPLRERPHPSGQRRGWADGLRTTTGKRAGGDFRAVMHGFLVKHSYMAQQALELCSGCPRAQAVPRTRRESRSRREREGVQ